MLGTLTKDGQTRDATSDNVLAALKEKPFFWLDLDDGTVDGTVAELLGILFGFHPLAVQSAERFSQRPRVDDYDNFVYLVARGGIRKERARLRCISSGPTPTW
jgi:magnesium transporter